MNTQLLNYKYKAFNGVVMSDRQVDHYNNYTQEISRAQAAQQHDKVNLLLDQRAMTFKTAIGE